MASVVTVEQIGGGACPMVPLTTAWLSSCALHHPRLKQRLEVVY